MGGGWTLAHVLTAHCALCCLQDCSGHTADCWPRLPHPPALQRCTVLYCAVLYPVLCPPHYTLPTLHTCHKCDMLVRRELYSSVLPLPITSSHHPAIQTPETPVQCPARPCSRPCCGGAGGGSCPVQLPPSPAPAPATSPLLYTQRRQCTIQHPENFHTPEVGHINIQAGHCSWQIKSYV